MKIIIAYIITFLVGITVLIPQLTTYIHEYGHYVVGNHIIWANWKIVINKLAFGEKSAFVLSEISKGNMSVLTKAVVWGQYISNIHFVFPLTTKEKFIWVMLFSMGVIFENTFRILLILLCLLSIKLVSKLDIKRKFVYNLIEINNFIIVSLIFMSVVNIYYNLWPDNVETDINDWMQIVQLFSKS